MNFVFLMDPLNTVKMEKDTSFILMIGAVKKGHNVFYLADGDITLKEGKVHFSVTPVVPQKVKENPFIKKEPVTLTDDQVDCVFIRTDPPFDQRYLINTWLLDRLPPQIPVINSPNGIRTVNEKIWATQFTSLVPRTLVSCRKQDILSFLQQEKDVIAKPTDGFGGSSIFRTTSGDLNANVIFETLTQNWAQEIILQKYVTASQEGDKRILVLDGEPLGAVLRVHAEGDHRNNFFSGGKPQACEITARDKKIIAHLGPELKRLGLYFVGVDIIGDYLIEVNVTSPTCLQEMNALYKKQLEGKVIEFAESLINQRRGN